MQYFFNRNGIKEEVKPEMWQWVAYYSDGFVLKQFADDGVFHQFKEIDQSRLAVFKMISSSFPQVYALPFNPKTMKLIHYYMRTGLNVGTPQFVEIKSYVFGYESKVLFKNVKHLTVIIPNGEVVMCEDTGIINFQ